MKLLNQSEWESLWFQHQVESGMAPGLVATTLELFRRWLAKPDGERLDSPVIGVMHVADAFVLFGRDGVAEALQCRRCCSMTRNAADIANRYCARCRKFLTDPAPAEAKEAWHANV